MMRILFIHGNSENIAGQEIALLNTIKGLKRHDIQSMVVLPRKGVFYKLLRENNISVFLVKLNRLNKKNLFSYLSTVFKLFKLLKKENISIIHCSGAYPTQYSLPASRLAGIPCIAHLHSTVYTEYDIKNSFVSHADYIITVSDAVKNKFVDFGCHAKKIKTIYCGIIDDKEIQQDNHSKDLKKLYNLKSDHKIVGQISLISPRKGLIDFLKMAQTVKMQYEKVQFLIVGNAADGYEDYEKELKDRVQSMGLKEDIIFTGFVRDIKKIMSILDISVLASLAEGLPFVIVESFSYGKPIVATSVGGIPEVVIDNQTGILIPPNDSDALANGVLKLLQNPIEAKRFGLNGKKLVNENFTIEKYTKELIKLYHNLLPESCTKSRYEA